MQVSVADGQVTVDAQSAPADDIGGFRERFDPWTGRIWLQVEGPDWALPITDDYGAARQALRHGLPDQPWDSDWVDGRFPSMPLGLPPAMALVVGVALAGGVIGSLGATLGIGAAAIGAVAVAWPVMRLRDGVVVRRNGLRIGPPWAAAIPWHEVEEVRVSRGDRAARVFARTRWGSGRATVPDALVPALRARLWRLGGLELVEADENLDDRYERWRAPAAGIPWGVLAGTLGAAWLTPWPWTVLTTGLLSMAALALLGAAVEARSDGWGTGAVLWSTGVYVVVLVAISVGLNT